MHDHQVRSRKGLGTALTSRGAGRKDRPSSLALVQGRFHGPETISARPGDLNKCRESEVGTQGTLQRRSGRHIVSLAAHEELLRG